jgi:membrane associated rhomboid family serine protease
MVFAPVGIRCPDHAGSAPVRKPAGGSRKRIGATTFRVPSFIVTKSLIALNVGIYLVQLAGGAPTTADEGWIFEHGALWGPLVAQGEWWRLITAAFLHYGLLHLALNMLVLWFVGAPIEQAIGRVQYLGLYLVSGLAGSAGALIVNPQSVTVGASGAIFGLFGALAVLEYQHTGQLIGGPAVTLIALNLAISFLIPGVSWGGHVGGLIGGTVGMLALSRLTRAFSAEFAGMLGLVAVGVLSVAVSYWSV